MKNKVVISLIVCLIVVGSVISFFIFNNNKQYEIKFDTLGGTTIQNVIVKNGDVVSKPEDPVKEGGKDNGRTFVFRGGKAHPAHHEGPAGQQHGGLLCKDRR